VDIFIEAEPASRYNAFDLIDVNDPGKPPRRSYRPYDARWPSSAFARSNRTGSHPGLLMARDRLLRRRHCERSEAIHPQREAMDCFGFASQ